jgi:hypothetical protein
MSSQAEYNFADWYRPVDNQLTAETQTARIAAIKVLLEDDDQSFWMDVVRLFWSIPIKKTDNKNSFIKAFKDADPVFPVTGNDHLLKVLAGILLCFRFETFSVLNNLIALSIKNVNFLGQYEGLGNVPVVQNSITYLIAESKEMRDIYTEPQEKEMNELNERKDEEDYEFVAADHVVVVDTLTAILHAQKVFSEETNILWWLFGDASIIYEETLKSVGLPKAIPVIAKELFDLLEFSLGTPKINSIINKAISSGASGKGAKDYSPFDMISKFNSDEIDILLGDYKAETEFTPILSALSKFPIASKAADLVALYGAEFHAGDLRKAFPPCQLAIQILNEYLLLKNLN